jgi:hypothetical protein
MNTRVMLAGWVLALAGLAAPAFGHCDSLDGPVVKAGREALEIGDPAAALIWVKSEGEKEVRSAFDKARAVRALGPAARDLADTYFLETLVRVHRAGEGEPYTGLKPAGEIPAGIALADKSIAAGEVDTLVKQVTEEVAAGIRARFAAVITRKTHAGHSVEAGREYVAAYVAFIHHVENLVSSTRTAPAATHAH